MKYFAALLILFFTTSQHAFSASPVTLPFKCIDNRIIVRVATVKNDTLNFLFDTGSDKILLDSTSAANYGLINQNVPNIPIHFAAGTVLQGAVVQNQSLFKDSAINLIYSTLIAIDAKKIPNLPGIPIHGIMGVNKLMRRYIIRIDFEKQTISLANGNEVMAIGKKTTSIPMTYTDQGHESNFSKYARMLPAAQTSVYISRGDLFQTNAFFDTGIRFDFLLLTYLKTDSLLSRWGKNTSYGSIADSAFATENKRYTFTGDSLKIGDNLIETHSLLQLAQTTKAGLGSFGDLQMILDIGVAFLKKYKTVDFDYPGKRIYLTSY